MTKVCMTMAMWSWGRRERTFLAGKERHHRELPAGQLRQVPAQRSELRAQASPQQVDHAGLYKAESPARPADCLPRFPHRLSPIGRHTHPFLKGIHVDCPIHLV